MAQQANKSIKIRTAVLIFLKNLMAPLVLYFENPQEKYDEIRGIIASKKSGLVEFQTQGPVKKVTVTADLISGVALQDEPMLG